MTTGRRTRIAFALALNLLAAPVASGYEVGTHRLISDFAFDQWVTKHPGYLPTELSIDRDRVFVNGGVGLSLSRWIGEGSVHEDDGLRSGYHFYDPVNNRGLTLALFVGVKAPDWAFEQPTENLSLRLSWTDARRSFLEGLTAGSPSARDAAMALTFRMLGDVLHLIQDMGSPEHTRNDPHAGVGIFGVYPAGAPSLFEEHVNVARLTLPYAGYSMPTFDTFRGFWTTGDGRGFAEFSNRGFITKSTNFVRLVQGAAGKGYPSSPTLDLNFKEDVDIQSLNPAAQGAGLSGPVTFYGNRMMDLVTGQPVENSRMTSYSVFDSDLKVRGQDLVFTINRPTVEAAARILLPRAVGYSAGLLDYFFRGRLDVGLADDVGATRVVGTNASDEPLSNGALFVYAENAAGTRTLASSAEGVTVGAAIAKNGALPDVPLTTVPADTERFVAVYKGGLGSEQPTGTAPGAVIGKVLGGVRVEEIFNDGTQWKLRTPRGVFVLKEGDTLLTTALYEEVKWGDSDNLLVARKPLDTDTTEHVVVYQVPRKDGSIDVGTAAGTSNVPLARRLAVPFPFGTVLTTLHASISVDYRQRLGRSDFKRKYTWIEVDPPGESFYTPPEDDYPPFTFEIAHEETVPFIQAIPVALDLDHNYNLGTTGDPYSWDLQETFVDAQGRILGLVVAYLGNGPQTSVPVFSVDALTGGLVHVADRAILPYLPPQFSPLLWALVDLGQGTVVASTADSDVAMNFRRVEEFGLQESLWYHLTEQYDGGPQNGLHDRGWFRAVTIDYRRINGTLGSVTNVTFPTVGDRETEVDGWLLADLLQAVVARGLYTPFPIEVPGGTQFVYYCDMSKVCKAMLIDEPSGLVVDDPGQFWEARRTLPVAGNERLVLLSLRSVFDEVSGGFGDLGDVMVWEPAISRARFVGPQLSRGAHDLGSAVGSGVLVSSFPFDGGELTTRLFKLDGGDPVAFPGIDLTRSYVLLEPGYLYNTGDLKFHRAQPSLDTTALPATLATVDGNPTGEYHAIRVLPAAGN